VEIVPLHASADTRRFDLTFVQMKSRAPYLAPKLGDDARIRARDAS
jgi:hypothetical protein